MIAPSSERWRAITNPSLLKKVTPQYAILSVGKNNYGHPSDSTLKLLAGRKIKTYRTDKSGTIVATSTGTNITFNTKPTVYSTKTNTATSNASKVVYITKTGKRYHLAGCSSLSRSKIKTTVREAKAKGLTPCNNCNPPK
jgi:competence protein ComEC